MEETQELLDAEKLVVEEAQVAELLQEVATATEPEPSSEWFQVVALVGSHPLSAVRAFSASVEFS